MPTPLDILLDPISLIIIGMYAFLMTWEAVFPGRTASENQILEASWYCRFHFLFLFVILPALVMGRIPAGYHG